MYAIKNAIYFARVCNIECCTCSFSYNITIAGRVGWISLLNADGRTGLHTNNDSHVPLFGEGITIGQIKIQTEQTYMSYTCNIEFTVAALTPCYSTIDINRRFFLSLHAVYCVRNNRRIDGSWLPFNAIDVSDKNRFNMDKDKRIPAVISLPL